MAKIKISEKYWNSLKKFEQEYLKQRVGTGKAMISEVKIMIKEARNQYPDYIEIKGKGFIQLPDGKVYLWSGFDTKKFTEVK